VTILETQRLRLRALTLDDLDALAALYRDPDVRRYFPEGTLTRAETREELEWIIDVYYGQHGYGLWATIFKETGAFIGRCGLIPWKMEGQLEVEVAYLLDKAYWGQGLATEAALAIRDYGFERLGLPRLICMMYPQNLASVRIAQKMGMTLEREAEDEKGPYLIYAMSRSPSPRR
jgi:ribosomal-protein-alanine N-acetyltransferase